MPARKSYQYSLIIPVYQNQSSITALLKEINKLNQQLNHQLQCIFVDDGSQDQSAHLLNQLLAHQPFPSKIISHARNFGSFAAIRTGLSYAQTPFIATMSADLQEPISLIKKFFLSLSSDNYDIAIGVRQKRHDRFLDRLSSTTFWSVFRRSINQAIPKGGVDVFAINQVVKQQLLSLTENNSSQIGLLFWLGFRRKFIPYVRKPRHSGSSSWRFKKKFKYLVDSLVSFSDLPIFFLIILGAMELFFCLVFSIFIVFAKSTGLITVPGYTATALIITFFAGINSIGLGVIGLYVWRTYENTKHRPQAIVMSCKTYPAKLK